MIKEITGSYFFLSGVMVMSWIIVKMIDIFTNKKYNYYVVYEYKSGVGSIELIRETKISEFRDMQEIREYISDIKPDMGDIVITSFTRMK